MPYKNTMAKTKEMYPWRAQVKINGKKHQRLCKTKKEARAWEEQQRQIATSLETNTTSLAQWGTRYLAWCESKGMSEGTFKEKQAALQGLLQFDEVDPLSPVADLDALTIYSYLVTQITATNKKGRVRGGGGANKDLKNLKAGWNWGIKFMKMPHDNPFNRIEEFAQNSKPRVMPSLDEFWKVHDVATTEQDKLMLLTYLYTAARREELFRLEWKHVDFKKSRIMLRTRKNNQGQWWDDWLTLDGRLFNPLKEHQKVTGFKKFVFLNMHGSDNPKYWEPYKKRQHWLATLCDRTGVELFGCHGIRHLCASILAAENVPLVKIQHHLRHRSITTTEKYIHNLNKEENQEVVRALPGLADESILNAVSR